MKSSPKVLSCVLIAALSLCQAGTVWSKQTAKKHAKKVVVNKKALANKPEAKLPGTLAVTAVAAPAVAVLTAQAAAPEAPATPPAPAGQAAPSNPYLANQPQFAPLDPAQSLGQIVNNLKMALPSLPQGGQSILPVIKTVYPTGEKPLVVITFKCPTELIGITPLPTKALHDLVNLGLDGINNTNLLAFNMQQVCQ